jgi:tetratricopeptide (TPR) repeat protein
MANELYALFGVQPDIEQATLRRSYFKALRKHPAEKDPVRHQELRQAYEVLGDEQRRREYDTLQEGDGEVARLMNEGNAKFAEEHWADAIRAYKRALALSPEHLPARLQLSRALSLQGEQEAAFKILAKAAPTSEALDLHSELGWLGLNDIVKATENEPSRMNSAQKQRLLIVREAFDTCIQLSPDSRAGYYGRARLSYFRENWADTRSWAEKSVDAGGEPDFEDYPALALIAETYILQGEASKAAAVIRKIQSIVPDQPEVRAFAAEQFIKFGLMLMNMRVFQNAIEIFQACKGLHPDESQLNELIEVNLLAASAYSENERIQYDGDLLPVTRGLSVWCVATFSGEFDENEAEGQGLINKVLEALDTFPPYTVKSQLTILKARYPHIWKMQKEFLDNLMDLTGQFERQNAIASTPGTGIENSGCGCLAFFALIGFGSLGAGLGVL